MKRTLILTCAALLTLASCVSKKKYVALQGSNETLLNKVDGLNRDLEECRNSKSVLDAQLAGLENKNEHLKDQINQLNNTNAALLNNVGQMATLSKQEAVNLEKSLEQIKEQDLRIRSLHDALTKKDSVTLALVVSLKSSLGNLNDTDVVVNVEKSVVFISLSDKMVFTSGSTDISPRAKEVLAKVATVINAKPEMEVLVEGHTDNVPIVKECIKDNWDLSVLRATSITRVLQKDYGSEPGPHHRRWSCRVRALGGQRHARGAQHQPPHAHRHPAQAGPVLRDGGGWAEAGQRTELVRLRTSPEQGPPMRALFAFRAYSILHCTQSVHHGELALHAVDAVHAIRPLHQVREAIEGRSIQLGEALDAQPCFQQGAQHFAQAVVPRVGG
jgi:chemotaxis protein MotB